MLTIWGPLRSISSLTIGGPPQNSFFAYYMGPGPLKSVSSLTIWVLLRPVSSLTMDYMGPPSGQFFRLLYMEPHQISFFAHYMGRAPSDQFLCLLCGGPLDKFFANCMGAPSGQFLRLLKGAPSDQFLRILYGGPPQINLFAYYMGAP